MYTRSYFTDEQKEVKLPQNYDGTAFSEPEPPAAAEPLPEGEAASAAAEPAVGRRKNPWEEQAEKPPSPEAESVMATVGKLPLFGRLFGKDIPFLSGLRLPKIGSEEILIIGAALFLLFSKDGDKECAVILLLLLLVN